MMHIVTVINGLAVDISLVFFDLMKERFMNS